MSRNEKSRRRAQQALAWPVAAGRVVESRIAYARHRMDEDDVLSFWYAYEVNGVRHVAKSIGVFGMESKGTLEDMEAIVQKYPVGAQITVHHAPGQPSDAVIDPGNHTAYIINRRFGLLAAIVGAAALVALFLH